MASLRYFIFILFLIPALSPVSAQSNMLFTNPDILPVLKGEYDPAGYMPAEIIDSPDLISSMLPQDISPDSMKSILFVLSSFKTRNTGSDTLSATEGIGAARTWILGQFDRYSEARDGRLLTGYFQFDQDVCGMGRHKNVVAVLPGRDTIDPSFILIEGHFDSRCEDGCDIDCVAEGMEDNGSGTALVMELARVMSRFVFDHTIIFMPTTGEEQGLVGANAFAQFAVDEGLDIKAVLNNDVIGGIICGETSSPPSCPGLNHIDSTQVRLFSNGGFNSPHKSLARFIKLQYDEMIRPGAEVPMMITLMTAEDRAGRGGDHIPFREQGFPAMRFTSANEHGDAGVNETDYSDRQHTTNDILGVDTDGDEMIDSFFVDFNYLARNATINGNAAAMAALGPRTPQIASASQDGDVCFVSIDDPYETGEYVIGLRVDLHDFDTLYRLSGATSGFFTLPDKELYIFLSVASVDSNGIESLFSEEESVFLTSVNEIGDKETGLRLFQNIPNPFDEATMISFYADRVPDYRKAAIEISDPSGRHVNSLPVSIREGINEVVYQHGYGQTGMMYYSLVIDGRIVETRSMQFVK